MDDYLFNKTRGRIWPVTDEGEGRVKPTSAASGSIPPVTKDGKVNKKGFPLRGKLSPQVTDEGRG